MRLILPNGMTVSSDDSHGAYLAAFNIIARHNDDLLLDVEKARVWALQEVQRLRGEARKAYVPDVHGQELVYANKLRQAQGFLAVKEANPVDYPVLSGEEAKARGLSVQKMAELIIAKASEWQRASDKIDATALKAKTTLQDLTSVNDIVTTLARLAAEIGG